jgi:hypothetical protein
LKTLSFTQALEFMRQVPGPVAPFALVSLTEGSVHLVQLTIPMSRLQTGDTSFMDEAPEKWCIILAEITDFPFAALEGPSIGLHLEHARMQAAMKTKSTLQPYDWAKTVPEGTKDIACYRRPSHDTGIVCFRLQDDTLIPVTCKGPWTPRPEYQLEKVISLLEWYLYTHGEGTKQ